LLVENFFIKKERTLIVSNTNQAVDQVLLKLCQVLGEDHEAVKGGHILRRGKIDLAELGQKWGEYIDIDSIVTKKSKVLKKKEANLESQIAIFSKKIEKLELIISTFETIEKYICLLDTEKQKITNLENEKSGSSTNIKMLERKIKNLSIELEAFNSAGPIKRLILRSNDTINLDISVSEKRLNDLKKLIKNSSKKLNDYQLQIKSLNSDIKLLKSNIKEENKKNCQIELEKISKKCSPLESELLIVKNQIEGIRNEVIENASIIGATVTRTFLQKSDFTNFDNVIIDEASMVLLPALYNVVGLAKERCIISGDFRQIPPIVETKQKGISKEIGGDIFSYSGIEKLCKERKKSTNLIMLKQQYRMKKEICDLINTFMYHGELVTANLKNKQKKIPFLSEFSKNILIVDTSKIIPFAQKKGTSYYNLMHVIAAKNLINIIGSQSNIKDKSIGIGTPYSAQSKIHHAIHQNNSNVVAGTIHRFQGDEKDIMIIDTVDSLGDAQVGFWASADQPQEDGCRLWNVGISRAKDYLIFIANLTHLNKYLPKSSFLRKILYDAQLQGEVIEIETILKLDTYKEDISSLQKKFELDSDTLEKGLFNNNDFEKVFLEDIKNAQQSIGIFSGFITPNRVAHYGDIFRQKIASGVTIRCVTRPPKLNGSMKPILGKEALDSLEAIGCIVDTRASIHQKAAIIDDEISWFGSLNPLSHTSSTEETMARVKNKIFASQLCQNLSINFMKKAVISAVTKENPNCDACGFSRTSFHFGVYGRPDYWRCESCENLIPVTKQFRKKNSKDAPRAGGPCSENCNGSLVVKSGKYGQFYGCSNFPKCKKTSKI
jgi:hypothetical protein